VKHYFFITNFIVVVFSFSSLNAQNWQGGGRGNMPGICEISGVITELNSGEPIEYASISVLKSDGNIETGGVTDSNGRFHIKEIKPGTYDLKIEFMGYETQIINGIELSFSGVIKKDMGEIRLKSVLLQMDEINVVDDRPVFEFETDKMIYNASDDIITDSGTAEDVLNKVPMVTVDQDGSVELRGNSNVKILVNGRPNRTGAGSKDVDNIPASLIDKVEVITSPSAKYDPDGMAGIINIVLKKGRYEGLNGSIKINGKHNANGSFGDMNGFTTYGNYKGEKWNVYSSYNLNNRLRNTDGHRMVNTHYHSDILPDSIESIHFNFLNNSNRKGHSFKIGTDYSVNEHLIINGEINYDIHLHSGTNQQHNVLPFTYNRFTDEIDFDNNYDIEGFFDINKTFDNPDREFNLSASYDYEKDNEYEILSHSTIDSTTIKDKINGWNFDVHYKHPFNENSKIEIGYDGRINDNIENMIFEITKNEELFSGINDFNYNRSIHSIFVEYDRKLNEKFSIKPSLRYEFVSKDIAFYSTKNDTGASSIIYAQLLNSLQDSVYIDSYSTFYPDLHFTYNLSDKKSIQFGMSKRVNRPGDGGHGPGSHQIRPFPRDVYSENFVFLGNPFLKPEYSTQYDLSYKSPMPMGFAYVNFYYHQLENVIEWYDDDRFEDKDVLTFRNADSGTNLGLELFTMVMGQALGGGYNLSQLEDPSGDYELNGNSKRLTLYSRINLPEEYIKLFNFEFGLFFMKLTVPGGDLFGAKGTAWANMGISKSIFDSRMEISFGINNLFNSGGFQMKREKPLEGPFSNGYLTATEFTDVATRRGGRTFKLNLIYRFGQLQEEKRRTRNAVRGGNENMDMGY
jgi:outer membrane receptor protein involved in Fe transport